MKYLAMMLVVLCLCASILHAEVKVLPTDKIFRRKGDGFRILTGKTNFGLGLLSDEGLPTAEKAVTIKALRLYPSKRGWEGVSSFLQVYLDEVKLLPGKFTMPEATGGKQGRIVLVSRTDKGKVTVTFTADDKSDHLDVSVTLEATEEVKQVKLFLRSTPGEYENWAKKRKHCGEQKTMVLTPTRTITDYGKGIEIKPAEEPWLLLYDENYDPARNKDVKAENCAAGVRYDGKQVKSVSLHLGPGTGNLTLGFPGVAQGDTFSTSLTFWEFYKSNQQGIDRMKQLGAE